MTTVEADRAGAKIFVCQRRKLRLRGISHLASVMMMANGKAGSRALVSGFLAHRSLCYRPLPLVTPYGSIVFNILIYSIILSYTTASLMAS